MSSRMTSADYQQILEEDWSPLARANFEAELAKALRREQAEERQRARDGARHEELTRRRALIKWQGETFRALKDVFCAQFEVTAWEARTPRPSFAWDARNALALPRKGLTKRLTRARAEAASGCDLQRDWLQKHAEMIAAVEFRSDSLPQ